MLLSQRAWDAQWGEQDHRWELDRGLVSECLQAMDLRDFMVSEILRRLPTCGHDSSSVPRAVGSCSQGC